MAYSRRTKFALAIACLFVAFSNANLASGAELPFTVIDRQDLYGSSGLMCENVDSPEKIQCNGTLDQVLVGQRLLLDFGRPVALSGFANLTPAGLANEQETVYALPSPDSFVFDALSNISVTQTNDWGLHAEFPAVVAQYVLWSVDASYEKRREGTSFWSTLTRMPNGLTDGLRFYGEPVAVPEPSGLLLLVVGGGLFCCALRPLDRTPRIPG